jgi:hypothetical protein
MVASMVAAIVVFCIVQDRVTSTGVGQYVVRQRAALTGGGPAVRVDSVMRPWIARSVREGLAWGALPLTVGVVLSMIALRRTRRA